MKQEYVIDANVLFSAFISGKDIYNLLFSEYTIYVPDYAFLEIEKYKQRILKKTKLDESELQEFIIRLMKNVTVIPGLLISKDSFCKALKYCSDIDEKDTMYIAAALELNIYLITNDKALCKGLMNNNFSQIILLGDVMNTIPDIIK